jgi:hypothetical protein
MIDAEIHDDASFGVLRITGRAVSFASPANQCEPVTAIDHCGGNLQYIVSTSQKEWLDRIGERVSID